MSEETGERQKSLTCFPLVEIRSTVGFSTSMYFDNARFALHRQTDTLGRRKPRDGSATTLPMGRRAILHPSQNARGGAWAMIFG